MSLSTSLPASPVETIRVLHVDDEPDLADLARTYLHRADGRFAVEPATTVEEGLERLDDGRFDCVLSDYDMPGRNGIEFLETVRGDHPHLPFILFTGQGSEEVASDAIAAGVTDYLQKEIGTSQYRVLAIRIANAVEQYRTRLAVEETERRLSQLAEKTDDILFMFDGDWSELLFVNSAYETIWGRTIAELREDPGSFVRSIHADDRAAARRAMAQLSDGEPIEIEYRVVRPDGSQRWVHGESKPIFDDEGAVDRIVGFVRDITGRTEREQELTRVKDRFRAFTEYSLDIVTEIDRHGVIQYASPSVEPLLGHDQAALVGERAFDYVHPEDRSVVEAVFAELIDHPETTVDQAEYRFRHADGSWVWLESVGSNRTGGALDGYVITSREITERRAYEERLEQQNDRLTEFAGVVSHDLRNPLSVAVGRLALAAEECDSDHHDAISTALDRMDRIIEDVLWLAREGRDIGSTTDIALGAAVRRAWAMAADDAAATLRFADDAVEGRLIEADGDRLSQLLENLFRNAVEHAGPAVTVTVGGTADGFYVEDDGPGIPAAEREAVFEAGDSTSAAGTGFGLRIVKQVVDAHGWTVRAVDGTDGGARFELSTAGTAA